MKKSTILTLFMFGCMLSFGQNISVTFTATGAATTIDSVTATNQRTNQSITFPGRETLLLTLNTGIPLVSELTNPGLVFPNPFPGRATFSTTFQKPQTVYLIVQNLVGQVVAKTQAFVQTGENEFELSLKTAGIYMLTLTSEEERFSYKILCSGSTTAGNSIQYLGAISNHRNPQNNQNPPSASALKSLNSGYTLGYTPGDIINYRCMSGDFTTILSDSPVASIIYDVEFSACTDADGKNYSVVNIGTQTWMAENLAYLPSVGGNYTGSNTEKYYTVYGYEGTNVSAAKQTANYTTYGVLYNWLAAMNAESSSTSVPSGVQGICPVGWHLPSDAEWTILTDYLGTSAGGRMKETGFAHWISPNTGATNASGFTALPGGVFGGRSFVDLGTDVGFWSSSVFDEDGALSLYLAHNSNGVNHYINYRLFGFSVRCLLND